MADTISIKVVDIFRAISGFEALGKHLVYVSPSSISMFTFDDQKIIKLWQRDEDIPDICQQEVHGINSKYLLVASYLTCDWQAFNLMDIGNKTSPPLLIFRMTEKESEPPIFFNMDSFGKDHVSIQFDSELSIVPVQALKGIEQSQVNDRVLKLAKDNMTFKFPLIWTLTKSFASF